MSVCRYCGQNAGWFRDTHDACVQKGQQGIQSLKTYVTDAVMQDKTFAEIKENLDKLVADSSVPNDQVLAAIKEGWSEGAEKRSVAQPVSDYQFSVMSDVYQGASLSQDEMRATSGFRSMVFSFLIWTVLHDEIEPYTGQVQFNLQKGEVPVFGMANVLLSEERATTSYAGAYSGASIRVAHGLYYHLGGMRGHRVESASIQEVDYGDFLMTTQAIYFGGREHGVNFRLPYKQIVRFQPYSDAVGICKNGGKEKFFSPQQVKECG